MKKLLALLLALVMCLALFACADQGASSGGDDDDGEGTKKPSSSSNAAVGTWILESGDENAPFTITFDAEGTCKFSTGETYTWKKKLNKDSSDALNLLLKEEDETVYNVWVYSQDDGTKSLELDNGTESLLAFYRTQNLTPDSDLLSLVMGEWYADPDYDFQGTVTFSEDGTCSVKDETMSWTASYWDNENRTLYVNVFDSTAPRYNFSFELYDTDVARLYLNDVDNGESCELYQNPLLCVLMDDWYDFAYGDTQLSSFYLSSSYSTFDWKLTSCDEEQLLIQAFEENSSDVKYELTLTMNGDYPQIALVDLASGETWLYYSDDYGYDEACPEALYQLAVYNLNKLENGDSFWVEDQEEYLRGNEGYAYVYQMFQSLGDYKDSMEYLERFTIYTDMLTLIDVNYTDNLGNTSNSELAEYNYDANGRVSSAWGSDPREKYCVSSSYVYGTMYFEYDDAGVISQILIGYSLDSLNARCTPSYDANGNMISLHIQTNSSEMTATYTYDDQNRLIQATGPYTYSGEPQTITYTYDAAGQLIQRTRSWTDWYAYEEVTTYTYANGGLTQAVEVLSYTDNWSGTLTKVTTTCIYTCDDQGAPLTVSVTTDDPNYSYASQEQVYTYEDLYFYNGEV